MASITDILRWPEGRGWLVLSGGADAGGALRAQTLSLAPISDGGVVYIGLSEASSDATLDDMEDLGAPTGYLVNILAEDDATIRDQIKDGSLIMLDGTEPPDALRGSLIGAAIEAIRGAYEDGAVVLAEGSSAHLFGGHILNARGEFIEGLTWLTQVLILPGVTSLKESTDAQRILEVEPSAVVIGIGVGSALALGPEGALEIWGERQVTIAFGKAYQTA